MKSFSLIVLVLVTLLLITSHGYCQNTYKDITCFNLFKYDQAKDTAYVAGGGSYDPSDSVAYDATNGYWEFQTAATADTVISNVIELTGGGNDLSIYVIGDSLSATSSVRSAIYFGNYRGAEMGWNWTFIDSLTTDGDTCSYHVGNNSTLKNEVLGRIGIKIEEILACSFDYAIRIRHFQWPK